MPLNDKDLDELKKRKKPIFFAFIIILLLASLYFYRVFTSSSTMDFWGYFLIAVLLIAGFDAFGGFFKSETKYQENSKELNKDPKKNLQYPATSFDNFIAGRLSLAKCFWLYFMFFGIIISVISGYIFELGHQIILIMPVAYYILISISLWNCATLYTNHKLENKQTYGWAIATKILIVLNAFVLVGQIILMLNAK